MSEFPVDTDRVYGGVQRSESAVGPGPERRSARPSRPRRPFHQLDALETSVGFLMSGFAAVPSPWLAQAVLAQLEILSAAPDEAGMNPRRRSAYGRLIPTWSGIARRLLATHPVPL